MQAGLDTLLALAPLHLKQHCKGESGERAVIIQLDYCMTLSNLSHRISLFHPDRKILKYIHVFVCIYSMFGTVIPLNILNLPFRVVISINQVEFLMKRPRERKNS